jgi:hypothetical protein
VLIGLCFGLRISEILGLRWTGRINVFRSHTETVQTLRPLYTPRFLTSVQF